jgi:hypothetical protein
MERATAVLVVVVGCLALTTGCFYSSANVNLRDFQARGLSMVRFSKRDTTVQHYGRVRVTERTWAFGSCDEVAERALTTLLAKAQARGANRVLQTHFRGHWRWIQEPVCRRNLSYALLIATAFLPVPTSVTVYGEAVYEPSVDGLVPSAGK